MAHPQDQDEEDLIFNAEEIQKIIRDTIELVLGGNVYSHSRSSQWIGIITDKAMTRISKLNKPFKYVLRITLTQKNGSGLHTAAAYYWDTVTDGVCTVRWENNCPHVMVRNVDSWKKISVVHSVDKCGIRIPRCPHQMDIGQLGIKFLHCQCGQIEFYSRLSAPVG